MKKSESVTSISRSQAFVGVMQKNTLDKYLSSCQIKTQPKKGLNDLQILKPST